MHLTTLLLTTAALLEPALSQNFQSSSKRGLVFVPSKKPQYQSDNQIWVRNSDLSWYYNYQVQPSAAYSNRSQDEFEFVPMLWSPSNTFKDEIQALINRGVNITHVMAYNEPDGPQGATGGSAVDVQTAAENYLAQIEPLRKLGIKVGAPAVTGSPRGHQWLQNFFSACADLGTNCTVDFIPVHWYGNFEGLASHLGEVSATYPNVSQWITEYALAGASLADSQSFFKMSAEYFDRLDSVERYSYFGSFRSDVSNVGPNAAMLTQNGDLTDIGSWYLGGAATGKEPSSKSASAGTKESAMLWAVGISAAVAGLGLSTSNMSKATYITYNEGQEAKHLHLGNLVHDFKNPNEYEPYVEKGYADVSEPAPEWAESTALQNYALTLGKGDAENKYRVAAAAKTTKLEIKDPQKFFTENTLQSSDAKKWLSSRLSAAVSLAPHPPPQLWMLTGLILMQHATWTSVSSDQKFETGLQAPFDPTGVSAIRRSSVSEHVRPTFGWQDKEENRHVSGATIHETGKYPGTRGWAARWERVDIKLVGADKGPGGPNHIQLKGPKVAVVELEPDSYAEEGDEDDFEEKYWDDLLEATDE